MYIYSRIILLNVLNISGAIQQGDKVAFELLFTQYHEKLYFFILKKTDSQYLAEETVQETFIKLWEYRSSLKAGIPISAQLFRIAQTTLIDLIRKQQSVQKLKAGSLLLHSDHVSSHTVTERMETTELNKKLWSAIEQMPPVRKKVFVLSRINGLSYKQIADELSLSVKTVENHLSIALKKLRNFMIFVLAIGTVIIGK